MKLIKLIPVLLLLILFSFSVNGQNIGYVLPNESKKVRIPFTIHNNLIVLPIIINGQIKLNFILDTGVQYPILTEKYFAKMIGLKYTRSITIQGTGSIDSLRAMVASNVSLELPNGVKSGLSQSLLVLEDDYLNLKESLGEDVFGIIGYDIFNRFIVEIDYVHRYLTLHEPNSFKSRRRFDVLELKVEQTKPYINLGIETNDESMNLSFMIDTGASHTLLVNDSENKILPSTTIPSVIGRGLGGDIHGDLGRVDVVKVGNYSFENAIVSFPVEGDYGSPLSRGSRNGTIGSGLLSRFDIIFDYFSGHVYIKKNRAFKRSFEYDMSGLVLNIIDDQGFKEIMVSAIRNDSPSHLSGIKKGDILESINGYGFDDLKLTGINEILRQREGKKIVIKVRRGDEHFKTSFLLKKYI